MFKTEHYYLLKIQYLGFRYHGWQKQPDLLTVERMMQRTLKYVLNHNNFKFIAAGRTDAKVSVNETYVELVLRDEALDLDTFLQVFNANLPQDVRLLEIKQVQEQTNIIQAPKLKEYIYLFSFGTKNHPFCAPFMINFRDDLDIKLMQEGAGLMEGEHDFRNYAYKANPETQTTMTVEKAVVENNTLYSASFFPETSYVFRVVGEGFKRHQVRLMMGALFDLGSGVLSMADFKRSLDGSQEFKLTHIAQASGLILQSVTLQD
ncbi:tRNA pseudouridine synthase A [Leeuwenhoekiella nanhaiensis]|uniref:tRNA pseudouridine synthase A n=1 Tax=Leeuwenhoekiella nanhaiensis TaxID=1655491 RepID=A0A2G1VUF1_9FLAO|nr:tRNA pseudouridine(38-40) synthase TruA [Leeuwenhoekiella nanhaiensis]PHQ30230.1 tRNA pseudouridine(38-40) synthase TruA [Leeuwenhoekiella nanhaiensis]